MNFTSLSSFCLLLGFTWLNQGTFLRAALNFTKTTTEMTWNHGSKGEDSFISRKETASLKITGKHRGCSQKTWVSSADPLVTVRLPASYKPSRSFHFFYMGTMLAMHDCEDEHRIYLKHGTEHLGTGYSIGAHCLWPSCPYPSSHMPGGAFLLISMHFSNNISTSYSFE